MKALIVIEQTNEAESEHRHSLYTLGTISYLRLVLPTGLKTKLHNVSCVLHTSFTHLPHILHTSSPLYHLHSLSIPLGPNYQSSLVLNVPTIPSCECVT